MKLATYRDGSRDGQLVVVARDLASAHYATGIATRLQQALDDWNFISPQLHELAQTLDAGRARHAFAFDPTRCMAPLPRAFQHAEGAACLATDGPTTCAEPPEAAATGPRLVQASGDSLLGPCDDIVCGDESSGLAFQAGLAVVTGDVPAGASAEAALEGVRLVMLASALRLRELMPAERAGGCGWVQSRPATAFAPVALTPDELGDAWRGGRVHLSLQCDLNGAEVARCEAGSAMLFHFGQLIAHLACTRRLGAGTIVRSGLPSPVSLRRGDTLRIEVLGGDARKVFGAIEQTVRAAPGDSEAGS